jgi:ATP-dependent RNA helicase RhlE
MTKFQELGLSEPLLRALTQEGYTQPTPIQLKAIPVVLAGHDLLGCAQTGTGKTAAFALPLIERMRSANVGKQRNIRLLVLAPTRELASQIYDSFRTYGQHTHLRATVIYGKVSQQHQVKALRSGVDIVIATPGRLLDLMQQRLIELNHVEALVLDEADRMLDMGFINDVRKIAARLPTKRQTLLFTATMPEEVKKIANQLLHNPTEVQAEPQSTAAPKITQSVYHVGQKQKSQLLVKLLNAGEMKRVIVFTRTKHGADKLQRDLTRAGLKAEALHGNKSQNARERALKSFKSSQPPVLVATDLASRGIDVDLVSHVVNFDLPHEPETYVHRIGRTGRAGESGIAVSFCDTAETSRLKAIERLIRQAIPVKHGKLPPPTEAELAAAKAEGGDHPARRSSRGPGPGRRDSHPGGGYGAPSKRKRFGRRKSNNGSTAPAPASGADIPRPARPPKKKFRRSL